MSPWHLLVLSIAAWRTTVLLLDDRVSAPIREWVWARWPYGDDPTADDPAGRGEATRTWLGRRITQRYRHGLARAARLWRNSWGDRIEARDRMRPGSTRLGYLFTCPWCMGVWQAALWLAAFHRWPHTTVTCAQIAAAAGAVGALYEIVNDR